MGESTEDDSTDGGAEESDDRRRDEAQEELGPRCPVCKTGRMVRGCEFPRPTVAELLAIPWRELAGAQLVQQQFL